MEALAATTMTLGGVGVLLGYTELYMYKFSRWVNESVLGKIIEISYDEGFHSTKKHGVRTYYDGEDIVTREEYLQVIWP
ncbi:MAG: hypothetical protein QGH85_01835 [Candidatus Pacebacteria bacterium]|jgi:hypothetical protein|nr:hypothetical protein [Candidatus Paceibacterota bacterium]MDP7159184.1 hypothetical protein [Candidatus Paceibacterota bacterium]MDP7367925.1 hypothetical protein [Candidatus Paceibacterota bacterium]MDP7466339.1 hypothetical protein [Candidatus Paceibacterota bacterium]MDP7648157.1 hypothetical protein [Candidatus Paceibacterota bacterium]|tara:strand:+ start:543 stop:779 length:237 start_codon:yes stop_codon:yes gene_type:complete